ncbi:MAG TPA: Holliday junction branch migration protein RuvA [Candidatus Cloacimonadota bacterium]|nr:Holliday junction branch migration protein RuvA [Candidatus Cloacimonadota bacterium]HPS37796.1 Holliday junction branch migration protein RuvA [Candidatus Cloacimonadota bacterium]
MLNYIKGMLAVKSPVMAVIESSGLGWELRIPVSTYEKLPKLGETCQLYTFLNITQDGAKIYGFATIAECELFKLLISVSGVGPRIAISVISTMSIGAFSRAILSGEEGLITKVPGLGKKSAQRLIIELKDKIQVITDYLDPHEMVTNDSISFEVENALLSLGFNIKDIRRELSAMNSDSADLTIEQLIKETIKRLYQKNK